MFKPEANLQHFIKRSKARIDSETPEEKEERRKYESSINKESIVFKASL